MQQPISELLSVLVVEDEPNLADLYEQVLQDEFDVHTALSGHEALEIIDDTVDVVLLDRKLPDMSGEEVLAELRTQEHEQPVAMVTGVEPSIDIVDMPFDEYLIKPVDRESLVRTVRVLANRVSFEETSRELFRLVSKKNSLDTEPTVNLGESDEYSKLVSRMMELQTELNDTITSLVSAGSRLGLRPDQTEIQTLLTEVMEHTLPDDIRELVDQYQELKGARPPFMWKWVHQLAPKNTLPCVSERYTKTVPVDKTLTILFITLLDDTLEKHRDRSTFNELAKIPFEYTEPNLTSDGVNTEHVRIAQRVWWTLSDRLQQAPHYAVYDELFRYDLRQAITAIEYTNIAIQRPDLATLGDLERYESHNMVMFAYADIDLMYSPIDIRDELSSLREVIWTAQLMARIGNWVSTWERELREGDYSSGPVVYALNNNIVSRSELDEIRDGTEEVVDDVVKRIKSQGVENRFLRQWEQQYNQLHRFNRDLSTMDLEPFIDGTEEVLRYHLASTGFK